MRAAIGESVRGSSRFRGEVVEGVSTEGDGADHAADERAARVAALLFAEPSPDAPPAMVLAPAPSPGDDVSPGPLVDHGRTRAFVAWYGELLDAHRLGAQALADHNLAPGNAAGEGAAPPAELGAVDALLRTVHQALLEHPIAARAIFAGFVQEGRRHAETPEGRELRAGLARSRAVHRAALLWRTVTMGMLSETEEAGLPSAYLDNLARLATDPSLERILAGVAAGRRAR